MFSGFGVLNSVLGIKALGCWGFQDRELGTGHFAAWYTSIVSKKESRGLMMEIISGDSDLYFRPVGFPKPMA